MISYKYSFLTFLAVCIFTFGCKKDDPSLIDLGGLLSTGDKTFSCNIDGQDIEFPELLISGASGINSGIHYVSAAGIHVAGGDSTLVDVSITFPNDSVFVVGSEFHHENGLLGDFSYGYYGFNANSDSGFDAYSTASGTAEVIITDIDTVDKTWSCTFSFTAIDDDGLPHIISNGEFVDVNYD